MADQLCIFAPLGGGAGDLWWDLLHDKQFQKIPDLIQSYGARVRIYSQCHCIGTATDLFKGYRNVEVIEEPWQLPSPELGDRWNNVDADGHIPISRNDLLHQWGVRAINLQQPQLYLDDEERNYLGTLLTKRPLIVAQPYAGLSDRDGFDRHALTRLAHALHDLNPNAQLLVIGKNHDRGHKYSQEECPQQLPGTTNLIDRLGIRVAYFLVANCDAFVGAHSNLIRAAWDHRKRTALVVPDPLMTRHFSSLDRKYTYGIGYSENRTFTYPFDHGQERQFGRLDTEAIARFLLRGV